MGGPPPFQRSSGAPDTNTMDVWVSGVHRIIEPALPAPHIARWWWWATPLHYRGVPPPPPPSPRAPWLIKASQWNPSMQALSSFVLVLGSQSGVAMACLWWRTKLNLADLATRVPARPRRELGWHAARRSLVD